MTSDDNLRDLRGVKVTDVQLAGGEKVSLTRLCRLSLLQLLSCVVGTRFDTVYPRFAVCFVYQFQLSLRLLHVAVQSSDA